MPCDVDVDIDVDTKLREPGNPVPGTGGMDAGDLFSVICIMQVRIPTVPQATLVGEICLKS